MSYGAMDQHAHKFIYYICRPKKKANKKPKVRQIDAKQDYS